MSVYVDFMKAKYRRMIMCHMMADTLEELHDMADKIGVKRKWFQVSRTGMPHYDICLSKRKLAINCGALEINRNKVVELMRKYRKENK